MDLEKTTMAILIAAKELKGTQPVEVINDLSNAYALVKLLNITLSRWEAYSSAHEGAVDRAAILANDFFKSLSLNK